MAMYVTGNLNLFDQRSAREYGYDSVRDHYEDFVAQWHEDVTDPEDHVYILGNLSQYSPMSALNALEKLPGIKHLMSGPRDLISPEVKKGWMEANQYANVFRHTSTAARRRLHGQDAILSHYGPFSKAWWAPRKTDAFYVTAHMDIQTDDDREPWVSPVELSVSWATWNRLVDWEEVKEMFTDRSPIQGWGDS